MYPQNSINYQYIPTAAKLSITSLVSAAWFLAHPIRNLHHPIRKIKKKTAAKNDQRVFRICDNYRTDCKG